MNNLTEEEMNTYKEIEKEEKEMEMQMKLDEIGKEKEKTLAENLSNYASDGSFELDVKMPKIDMKSNFRENGVELSRVFIHCLDDFRAKFKYCPEAQNTIIELLPVSAILTNLLMSYGGGVQLGDYLYEQEVIDAFCSNRFKILDFLKLYAEVKDSGKSKIDEALEKLTGDEDGEKS